MTLVLGLAALWLLVSCVAALVIGRGLRVAERVEGLRRTDRFATSRDVEVLRRRRLVG